MKLDHGGDTALAENLYGRPEQGWLDLSTGINPRPYPVRGFGLKDCGPLPGTAAMDRLRRAAAGCYGVADASLVVAAPGAQSLIQWLPRLRPPCRVAVVSPTYGEHAHCWRAAGHSVEEIAALPATGDAADVIVAVNPNNPDGRRHDRQRLMSIRGQLARRGGWLVVDESFCDVAPETSLAGQAGESGLIILRSFGKFYGLAGLRLGFALADADLSERLARFLGPWAVSTPAVAIGTQALDDGDWADDTRLRLGRSAKRLDLILDRHGLKAVGGTALFRLVETASAGRLYDSLANDGILVRRFRDQPQWLRFGLPGRERDWKRLGSALAAKEQ